MHATKRRSHPLPAWTPYIGSQFRQRCCMPRPPPLACRGSAKLRPPPCASGACHTDPPPTTSPESKRPGRFEKMPETQLSNRAKTERRDPLNFSFSFVYEKMWLCLTTTIIQKRTTQADGHHATVVGIFGTKRDALSRTRHLPRRQRERSKKVPRSG